jgi:preprotein translocase SecE subunit
MAKTRAQRKAERRAREAQQQRQGDSGRASDSVAQHDTQVPRSAEVAEAEAVEAGIAAGAEAPEQLPAPAPARVPRSERRAEERRRKEAEKREREERKRQERERLERQKAKEQRAAAEDRSRGAIIGFLASCWAELKRVQWPDRETLVQASAVTLVFVAIAAAYLGALDAVFNFLIKRIL